jgi:hypothetical protein
MESKNEIFSFRDIFTNFTNGFKSEQTALIIIKSSLEKIWSTVGNPLKTGNTRKRNSFFVMQ